MTINVLNLPGDYKILALNGFIYVESGADTEIQSGGDIIGEAVTNIELTAGADILQEAGSNVEVTAGADILQDAGANFEVTASGDILGDAGANIEFTAGGDILGEAGSNIDFVAPGTFTVDSPDSTFTGDVTIEGNTFVGSATDDEVEFLAQVISDFIPKDSSSYNLGANGNTWLKLHTEEGEFYSPLNVGNPYGRLYDPGDIYDTEAHRRQGAVYIAGGLGIEKDLNVGGYIYGRVENAVTTTFIAVTSTNIDNNFYLTFVLQPEENNALFTDMISSDAIQGLRYNPYSGRLITERIYAVATDTSYSTTSGSIVVNGGIGVAKDITIGGNITPAVDNTSNLGSTSSEWAEAYIQDLYTRFIKSTTGTIQIAPKDPLTEIMGDIRVRGVNPIGTAPMVSNTLYVTMDGNDTNDGRAQDSSRACRTIGGALNSPYYQPGTQILVSAGRYLEDNPLRLKPYTSIRGSDIRTTFIEPINKTQDLFHLDSGCYLNYMTFLNGRSGLLEGPYDPKFNRGAYATAFPPLTGDERIDLFHSPYVQNCTNQSGPWLRDGTMFVPNQTVQIPTAVGTGTWEYNTTSIVVSVSTGTITQGMYVNSGQQNPGFFNARTLLLANKPFLQEQVVKYVDITFNSSTFVYDVAKCERDIELILDSLANDLVYNSESESIFAGLQYWRQGGYVDAIGDQITTTTNAIKYVKEQAITVVTATSSLLAGTVAGNFDLIDKILNTATVTLSNGVFAEWVTGLIVANPNGAPSTNPTTITAYNNLLAAKTTIQNNTINYITSPGGLNFTNFNTATCFRDVGYIIDSIAFDLLHGGSKQSVKSGVYYFGYTSTATEIPNEIPQTVQAYNFIKSLIPNVVLGKPIINVYQTGTTQVIALNSATIYEVEELENRIEIITDIIRNGPDVVEARIPIGLDRSEVQGVLNAYDLLLANKNFIVDETIAFINTVTSQPFVYSREKCFRDVGILVENVSYDAAFGGNQKAVESGLAYYDGVISRIAGQETQTISAIDYLNNLAQKVITNTTCTDLFFNGVVTTATYSQVRNIVLTGGDIASDSIDNLFNIITDIIEQGPIAAPTIYTSTGPDAAFVSAETLMQANRSFIQQDTINYINNIIYSGALPYSEIKCRRDTGLIIDSIKSDLLFPTDNFSQSTFAGLQYWSQEDYVGDIAVQINPTVSAIEYLKETAAKIIKNITPADDLVPRYYTGIITQDTSLESATDNEVTIIQNLFDIILEILNGNKLGWTDRIISNGTASSFMSIYNAYDLLQANKEYLGYEITAYVDATNFGLVYDAVKCRRDVGYLIDAVCFDMIYGGNRQSIQNGLYYYGFTSGASNLHGGQNTATIAAFNYLATITNLVVQNLPVTAKQNNINQTFAAFTATSAEGTTLARAISTITNIIANGTSTAAPPTAITFTATTASNVLNAYNLVNLNKDFIVEEVIAYIDQTFNPGKFNYDEAKCYRDVGLIVDAVSQDILLGGNQKSVEAGLAYWSSGYNAVTGQITTTTMAINHARDLSLQVIANTAVTPQTGTVISQIINPFFQYGGDYMPQQAVSRNFNIITDIIEKGPLYAPPLYAGGGLFALTGLNGSDVIISPQVNSVTTVTTGTFLVGLSTSTIGFGINSTLYFGNTLIFPLRDAEVEELSYELTGNTSTWQQRKIDPVGSMGGSLVDGAVISDRSPIQSFVYDAFTQVTQGGRGVHIKNDGYAQLVSVFTIFCSIGVEVENGGIASIVNSNANFGNICLQAKGYGNRKFSGTVYNPPFKSYPDDPVFNQYFPNGYWPRGGRVRVFLPDLDDRPHISLVMEVVPPDGHVNEQQLPGFLNANPTLAILNTGSITITGIDTENIAIGNSLYIRDQFGKTTGSNFVLYADTGTVVTDIGYQSVTLNKALTNGGGEVGNDNFFTLYFCGNAYYTVLSSEVGDNPLPVGVNVLSTASGIPTEQITAHVQALTHLNTITNSIINNINIIPSTGNTATQITNNLILDGSLATPFIDLRFDDLINIVSAANLTAAEAVVPMRLRTTSGPAVQGAGSAISLIKSNLDFMEEEISSYVKVNNPSLTFNEDKCKRDVKIILQRLIYDIETGGKYNCVMSGLSYWQRDGTHHLVQLGENVRRTDLFPDGATVNFYQRSYISASGYVFEYVGAGIDYGALPQRGIADPVQSKEVVMLNSGKVFFTSTDQNGDFRIGPGLVISQATGVLSGRTFTKSLFANMTPFILAIESGGG